MNDVQAMKETLEAANDKLLPCPFCGGKASILQSWDATEVSCDECYASAGKFQRGIDGIKDALAAWNKRARGLISSTITITSTAINAKDIAHELIASLKMGDRLR